MENLLCVGVPIFKHITVYGFKWYIHMNCTYAIDDMFPVEILLFMDFLF